MSVTKSDFIEIATRHGSNEQEALKDYDLMVSLNFDLSRMTRADLVQYFQAQAVLRIPDRPTKPEKKSFFSRFFGK